MIHIHKSFEKATIFQVINKFLVTTKMSRPTDFENKSFYNQVLLHDRKSYADLCHISVKRSLKDFWLKKHPVDYKFIK